MAVLLLLMKAKNITAINLNGFLLTLPPPSLGEKTDKTGTQMADLLAQKHRKRSECAVFVSSHLLMKNDTPSPMNSSGLFTVNYS